MVCGRSPSPWRETVLFKRVRLPRQGGRQGLPSFLGQPHAGGLPGVTQGHTCAGPREHGIGPDSTEVRPRGPPHPLSILAALGSCSVIENLLVASLFGHPHNARSRRELKPWSQVTGVQISARSFPVCVTLDKLLNRSAPQAPYP